MRKSLILTALLLLSACGSIPVTDTGSHERIGTPGVVAGTAGGPVTPGTPGVRGSI